MKSCHLLLIFALALSLAITSGFAKDAPLQGYDEDYLEAMETVHENILDEDYAMAYSDLSRLKSSYPTQPEVFYLLAYLRDRMYQKVD